MAKNILWAAARVVIFVINIFGFHQIYTDDINFGFWPGLLTGVIFFAVLLLWLRRVSRRPPTNCATLVIGAFYPMAKHPYAYWLTIGASFAMSSFLNLLVYQGNHRAEQLFSGLMMIGLGIMLAIAFAIRTERRRT